MKTCYSCKEEKALIEFSKNKSKKDGLQSKCKQCERKAIKAWRTKNKEKHSAKVKEWQEKNYDRHLSNCRKYKEDRPWYNKERHKINYPLNKDKLLTKAKEWRDNNPGWFKKYQFQNGLGVYLIKYRWINLYVGEGQLYSREKEHRCVVGKRGGKFENGSKVSQLTTLRNLNRKYLSFQVLEYEDNKTRMLELEDKYRRELKPYINPL